MKITQNGPMTILPGGETIQPIEVELTEEEYAEMFLSIKYCTMEEWLDGIEDELSV